MKQASKLRPDIVVEDHALEEAMDDLEEDEDESTMRRPLGLLPLAMSGQQASVFSFSMSNTRFTAVSGTSQTANGNSAMLSTLGLPKQFLHHRRHSADFFSRAAHRG